MQDDDATADRRDEALAQLTPTLRRPQPDLDDILPAEMRVNLSRSLDEVVRQIQVTADRSSSVSVTAYGPSGLRRLRKVARRLPEQYTATVYRNDPVNDPAD